VCWKGEVCTGIWWGYLRERNCLRDIRVDGNIIGVYRDLVGIPKGKKLPERHKSGWERNRCVQGFGGDT
jgi:ribosomal protein S14